MTEYTNRDALLLLNLLEGFNIKRRHKLIELTQNEPSRLLNEMDYYESDISKICGREHFFNLKHLIDTNALDLEKDKLYKNGVEFVTYLDNDYPSQLLDIYEFPTLLYVKGNKNLLKTRCISVVGSRGASRYGINVTRDFTEEFCRAGLTVVSGFARGIDSHSHSAAISVGGNTIAVVANGLDICYPAENRGLMKQILELNGLFVSEYSFGVHPSSYSFPERNRIISGLSEALFVPEARIKSGTLITVNLALEQGKQLFVVPSNINSPTGEGSNLLIKQMQASIVLSPKDVLDELNINIDEKEEESYQLSFQEQQIIEALEVGEQHFENLLSVTGLTVGELQNVLFELEMNDIIDKSAGNFYTLK